MSDLSLSAKAVITQNSLNFARSGLWTALFLLAGSLVSPVLLAQSTSDIIQSIQALESRNDPKCYATASRLEDFMFGTPLSFEARAGKNLLQRNLVADVWLLASSSAKDRGDKSVTPDDIEKAVETIMVISVNGGGHFEVAFDEDQIIVINSTDKRQYSSIAYSLRALLTVQQEALINGDSSGLLPLNPEAITALKDISDLYTLSVLKVADAIARSGGESEIAAETLIRVWSDLGAPSLIGATSSPKLTSTDATQPPALSVTRGIIEQKVASYAVYNAISNPLFVRNLQVYFAKRRWPADSGEAQQFRRDFTEGLIQKAADFYLGAQEHAQARGEPLIRELDVNTYVQSVLPHQANEYEDIIFFPALPKAGQVVIEAYDIDAFRDSGIHWRYLQYALDDNPTIAMEADAFALELITESIANVGVLMLRLAGEEGLREDRERLAASDIASAVEKIEILATDNALSALGSPTKPNNVGLASSSDASSEIRETNNTYFSDVTDKSGINYMHRSSNWLSRQLRTYLEKDETTGISTIPPAFGGGGAAAGDVDGDGDDDILLVGGLGNALYINQGDGSFANEATDRGLDWRRPDGHPGEPRQPLIADLDNDGDQDVIITYVNDIHRVYRNDGKGNFTDISAKANLGGNGLVGGPATVFDANNDGLLDIYITYFGNYLKGVLPTLARRNTNGLPNQLFINRDNLSFENVTDGSGLDNIGWGQAVTHTDFTGDGLQDVIAGNDFGVNAYYRNNGDLTFTDISEELGTDKPSYTMGIGLADLNADQRPDVYISNIVTMNKDQKYVLPDANTPAIFNPEKLANMRVIEANDLFLSQDSRNHAGPGYLLSNAVQRGYAQTGWSWGAEFFDADHDGDDDLFVLNGMNEFFVYSSENPYYTDPLSEENKDVYMPVARREQNVFFTNENGRLNIDNDRSGLGDFGNSRALLTVDIDLDGDLDLLVNNYHGGARVYRNNLVPHKAQSTSISVVGNPEEGVNLDGIGTQVIVQLKNGATVWRELRSSEGYMSVQPKRLHIGRLHTDINQLTVIWPNRKRQVIQGPFPSPQINVVYAP